MHTQATYQYRPMEILPYLRVNVETAQGSGRDLVQEAIDMVSGKNINLPLPCHVVALLDLMKKGGVLA